MEMLSLARPQTAWDLGANTGNFSLLAAANGIQTIAFDSDAACVERMYQKVRTSQIESLLPLVMTVAAPSPSIGWNLRERPSFFERGTPDMAIALALIHHLCIAHNIPLGKLPGFFAKLARWSIVEFVPKSDPMTQLMLASREDIFPNYTVEAFETLVSGRFSIRKRVCLKESQRIVYLIERKDSSTP
jgi:ribosomal protein L11 methylase PrmA